MSNIKVMDELLSNKIAAGEVVEKIVSIVKELTENSIDAKSSEIKIELIESGLREIKVVDNGIGMDKNDAKLCFQRHATSKLYTDDDLFSIETLGFRGEALPSIATVSDVVLKTCQNGSSEGTMIHIKGGKIIEESSSELRYGTSFTVTNLFYNTPARLKHLSSPYSELSNVIDYVNKISLSYPSIKFTLINDGKYLLNTDGSGNILKVINAIYGLDVTKRMFPIEGCNQDYNINGFISLPELNRASKNYITTLVNGRVIKNATLYRVINEAYSNYKEDSRYPIVVLYIETDPSLIDVNIHPSKLDIKFSNFEDLTELIKATIIKGIKQKLLIPQVEPTKEITPSIEKNKYENLTLNIERTIKEDTPTYNYQDIINQDYKYEINSNKKDETNFEEDTMVTQLPKEKLPELYPVGLLHGTYIVCENEDGFYLIDQHAAKERINYEKYKYILGHPNNNTISPLIPIIIELPLDEFAIIKENIDIFDKLNITLDEFGTQSYRVISHPTWFIQGKEEELIRKIIELVIQKEKNFSLEKFNDNLAKMISCKMSIKGNTYIDTPSMESLINDLRKCDNPFNCPHGRPTIIHFTKYELEKMFKRSM
jgi:DNA mismatch repair protein MutL